MINIDLTCLGTNFSCSTSAEYVKMSDGFETFKFCGNSYVAKFLMQSRSNWITVEYVTIPINYTASFYKGFQIYVEAYTSQMVTEGGSTLPTTSPELIYQEGFASNYVHDEICSKSTKTLTCPDNYIILVHEEHLVNTNGNGCVHTYNFKLIILKTIISNQII